MMLGRRVVVTGMGVVSSVGLTARSSWENVVAGRSGIKPIERFDVSRFPVRFGGMVDGFDPLQYVAAKDARRMDHFVQYGLVAGVQAVRDAKVEITDAWAERCGVSIGSGIGGLAGIEASHLALLKDHSPRKISPFFVPGSIINMISGNLSILMGLRGPNIANVTACTTGTHNIGLAARLIACGDADAMVAGGAEYCITPLGLGGFCAARALSCHNEDPQGACRPFSQDRDGFVMSDGAAALMLESLETAQARNARIYAELIGFGMNADAYHITQPSVNGSGAARCMELALKDAAINPSDIDYVNAHGTGTRTGDVAETRAIHQVFGSHAKSLMVSSTKSSTGHMLGAAGAAEAVFCVFAMQDQVAPPTINLHHPDPECDLDYVPHHSRAGSINYTLSNSFGFGGTNGTLVFRRRS